MIQRVLKIYPTLLRIGFAEAVAYRAEFLVWMLSMTLPLVMLAIWSAVAREGAVGGFDTDRFTAYYLATLLVRQLTGSWVVWEMIREVREGTLSMRLLRPIHPLLAHSAESLAGIPLRAAFSIPIAIGALLITSPAHHIHDPVIGLCAVAAFFGAWALNFSISAMVGTLALVFESSIAIWDLYLGMFFLFSGYLVPIALFPPMMGKIARVLPFAYLQSVPVEILTNTFSRTQAFEQLAIQWGYAALGLTCLVFLWQRNIKRFAAYGG